MINPLDLQTIFVNYFSGSIEIFLFVALIVIGYLAARFRMTNILVLIVAAVFIVFLAGVSSVAMFFYPLVIIVAGLIFYFIVARWFK